MAVGEPDYLGPRPIVQGTLYLIIEAVSIARTGWVGQYHAKPDSGKGTTGNVHSFLLNLAMDVHFSLLCNVNTLLRLTLYLVYLRWRHLSEPQQYMRPDFLFPEKLTLKLKR